MAKRLEIFNDERMDALFLHHPYLLIFQKDDWKDYLLLFAQIYDALEQESVRLPFEALRTTVLKHYAQKGITNIDAKIHQFFHMAIGELQVLKDSHDQFGQRFLETTRAGKQLLQLVEGLLERRVRFTGTGAEVLLGSLNDILTSRKQLSEDEALQHHKQKIKSYQDDLRRIQEKGIAHAELLPIPHSNEALFNQAEESAQHILTAIEDVKGAIERQRQELARAYFEGTRTAGQSVGAMAEFYEGLYSSAEYASYNQAKSLLSHLEGFAARFGSRDVDRILAKIREKDLVSSDLLVRSLLPGFTDSFRSADQSIQEKIKLQIRLLQQQVHYAINTDVLGLQSSLHSVLSMMLAHREKVEEIFTADPYHIEIPSDFDSGALVLSEFHIAPEVESDTLVGNSFEQEEMRSFFLALVQAEETTLREILEDIRLWVTNSENADLAAYPFRHGLAEYYVLSDIKTFAPEIEFEELGDVDIEIRTRHGAFVIRRAKRFRYFFRKPGAHVSPDDKLGAENGILEART